MCCVMLFAGSREDFCCSGYAIDLLVKLSKEVNFTFSVHLVEDNNFGTYERVKETNKVLYVTR